MAVCNRIRILANFLTKCNALFFSPKYALSRVKICVLVIFRIRGMILKYHTLFLDLRETAVPQAQNPWSMQHTQPASTESNKI